MASIVSGSGSSGSNTPTWEFVQEAISDNMDAAEEAIQIAYSYMKNISTRYEAIQAAMPWNWVVNTNIPNDTRGHIHWPTSPASVPAPQEPYYESTPSPNILIPNVNTPSSIYVQAQPGWDLTLSSPPVPPTLIPYSPLPVLGPLPIINVPIPTIDIGLLDTEFSFTEPEYGNIELTEKIHEEIMRVLGGDLGIPQAYWDSLWEKAAGDLAKQQNGLSRNARNRGAASFWGLPSEAVLVASRAVQDEGTRKLSLVRIEQAQKQAELAHDDYWKAMQSAITYHQQWIDFHNAVANRALAAAQFMATLEIQVHNANVQLYNTLLETAKLTLQIYDLQIQTTLKKYEAQLQQNKAEIEQNKGMLEAYTAQIQGYSISQTTQIQAISEKIKWWNSQWEADTRYAALDQEKAKLDLSYYASVLSRVDIIARSTAAMLGARTNASQFVLSNQVALHEQDKAKNSVELDLGKLAATIEETRIKLDQGQTEWLAGQGNTLLQSVAQMAVGLAQSLVTVSDVNLSSGYSMGESYGESASHNEPTVW